MVAPSVLIVFIFLLAPPREGRQIAIAINTPSIGFLLAPPREGRRDSAGKKKKEHYFYSRPHGRGDDNRDSDRTSHKDISTRAPTGGATTLIS